MFSSWWDFAECVFNLLVALSVFVFAVCVVFELLGRWGI
jgi:hypothetical protein